MRKTQVIENNKNIQRKKDHPFELENSKIEQRQRQKRSQQNLERTQRNKEHE